MKYQPFSPIFAKKGLSVLELLVALCLFAFLCLAIGSFAPVARRVANKTHKVTEVTQSLQSVYNYLSLDVRLAGENLPSAFPAVLLLRNPPRLTLRRGLVPYSLPLCEQVSANTPVTHFVVAKNGVIQNGCSVSGNLNTFQQWQNYAQTNLGIPFKIYVYDVVSRTGFYVPISQFQMPSEQLRLVFPNTIIFNQPLHTATTALYLIEELEFRQNGDSLILNVLSRDRTYTLAFNVANLDFRIRHNSVVSDTFTTANNWTNIEYIETQISLSKDYLDFNNQVSSNFRFFPRNILSH
ncbi:MAG: hypothetical protein NZO16_02890 [Deltaproteobacteria bacterium]|nr:hypothetical protein [Deltaproteobacteria bacterium]